jgi:hypothetical protein
MTTNIAIDVKEHIGRLASFAIGSSDLIEVAECYVQAGF